MEQKKLGPNGQLSAWTPRPRLAAVTSLVAHGGATVVAIAVGVVCSRLFPQPVGAGAFTWWVGIIAVGVLVLAALQPVARRALVLSGLLQLAIEFPTPPPSRVAAAWRGSDPDTVRRRLEQVHTEERSASLQTDLAVLAATLGVLEHRRRQAEVVFRVGDDDITTRVVESDIPGFFQIVPIGSSSRKVLVTVVASTAAAALAASAALGSGSSGTGAFPTAAPAAPPTASVDTTPPPERTPPSFDGAGTIYPSTPSPRAGAPADTAPANPPPGPVAVTPAPTATAGSNGSTQTPVTPSTGGAPAKGEVTTVGPQLTSASAATGAQPPRPSLSTADAAPSTGAAAPAGVVAATAPPAAAQGPAVPSPTALSAPMAFAARAAVLPTAGIDDTAMSADAGPVATLAPTDAPSTPEADAPPSDDTATVPEPSLPAPEDQYADAGLTGDDTQAQPPVDQPAVDAPTSETPPVPEAAGGTNAADLAASTASTASTTGATVNPAPPSTADQAASDAAPISP
jgi:hypothetical protein